MKTHVIKSNNLDSLTKEYQEWINKISSFTSNIINVTTIKEDSIFCVKWVMIITYK